MVKAKLYFHSMDAVFRLVAIDPDLPDPEKATDRYFRRVSLKPYDRSYKPFGPFDSPNESRHFDEEVFTRDYLVEPATGHKVWYWRRANG